MRITNSAAAIILISLIGILSGIHSTHAQSVADFYRGKSITMLIGYSGGGGYDLNARLLSKHMGKHIPGNPSIVPQNMPGAGSLRLANFLYNIAAKDGTTLGMIGRGMAVEPLMGAGKTQFDARRFTWLGSISDEVSLCSSWYTSPVKNWQDMQTKGLTLGALAPGDNTVTAPLLLRNLFGARIRFVSGYPGGNEINLAMERGEVDGRCGWSWSSIKTTVSDWLRDKRIHLLVQMALQKSRELPDVPLVMDMASNNRQRQILRLILSEQQMAWPVTAPPDLPPDHARALRAAFDATMQDPEFRAELARRRLDINPMSAAEIVQLISELYQTPEEVVAAAKAATSEGAR